VKPGELERNLSRLVEMARTARERLAAIETGLAELRRDMERLVAKSAEQPQLAAPAPAGEPHGSETGVESLGTGRRDPATRADTERPGREVGSE